MDERMNADRFKGFADTYESVRPGFPSFAVKMLLQYLGYAPVRTVDLGSGTGLSTTAWREYAQEIIGIEPSDDMIAVAKTKETENIRFIKRYAHDTGLENASADIVVCSQSFHWMEPQKTLSEVNRILKPGGVFAAVDCDWPPVSLWQAEKAYEALAGKVKKLESELDDVKSSFVRHEKNRHLTNIKNSAYFNYAREILFSNAEPCTAERFVHILLSQGGVQSILAKYPELIAKDVEIFKTQIFNIFGAGVFEIDFSYRMRIAVK